MINKKELARQLRVGNLLYYKNTKDVAKVELIHNNHFDCRDEYCSFTPNGNYEPIPLTEEILLKCGLLLYDELDGEYRINETRYSIHKVTNFDGFLFCDGNNVLSDIKYVHQLQNLYHALTGQELKIEL